jgi:peptidoglycan/LPS O-acetylase OafA/YrhL
VNSPADQWTERKHFPPLDGIRGIAIILVMVFHFFIGMPRTNETQKVFAALTSAGWVGVDLFFVLSGFLITGILINTKGQPRYFSSFYARRALRIFPAYYGFILFVGFILGPALVWNYGRAHPGLPSQPAQNLELFRSHQSFYWLYLTNVLIAIKGFAPTVLWMTPFWSLAVEEQFYLVWPLVVRKLSSRNLLRLAIVAFGAASLLRIVLYASGIVNAGVIAAMLTPTRMDPLALGAALAVVIRHPDGARLIRKYSLPAGVCALVGVTSVIAWKRGLPEMDTLTQIVAFPGNAIWGAAAIGASITAPLGSAFNAVLSGRLLRTFGFYSYGLYIVHSPVFWFVHRVRAFADSYVDWDAGLLLALLWFVLATGVALATAWTMWHLLERPFLSQKYRFPSSDPFPSPAAATNGERRSI